MSSKRGPKPFKRLYDMGAERMSQIDAFLLQGMTAVKLAEHIQTEWKACLDVDVMSLRKMIGRYRRDIFSQRLIKHIPTAMEKAQLDGRGQHKPKPKDEPEEDFKDEDSGEEVSTEDVLSRPTFQRYLYGRKIDLLEEYTELYLTQKDRAGKLLEREMKSPLLLPGVRDELKLLSQNLGDLKTVMFELGLVKPVPKKHVLENHLSIDLTESKDAVKQDQEAQQAALEALSGVGLIFEGEFEHSRPDAMFEDDEDTGE